MSVLASLRVSLSFAVALSHYIVLVIFYQLYGKPRAGRADLLLPPVSIRVRYDPRTLGQAQD